MPRFPSARLSAAVALLASLAALSLRPILLPARPRELSDALSGRTVLLCGASYGIGAELAYAFARSGARLALVARSRDKLRDVADRCSELGAAEAHVVPADLASREGSRRAVEEAARLLGEGGGGGDSGSTSSLDVLVLNHIVGTYEDWPTRLLRHSYDDPGALEADLDFVERMFRTNILSYIDLSAYVLPRLARSEGGGRILAVGSAAGKMGMPRVAPYASTKSAVFGYFESLRQDLLASDNPSLRSIKITTGVLGGFSTDNAVSATAGRISNSIVFTDPAVAAEDLVKGLVRGWNTVYTPWHQVRPAMLVHSLVPDFTEWLVRKITIPS